MEARGEGAGQTSRAGANYGKVTRVPCTLPQAFGEPHCTFTAQMASVFQGIRVLRLL